MEILKALVHAPGEGRSLWVLGDLYTFKASGTETGNCFTLIEQKIQPLGGPPLHVHHREDETFYVLEGKFSFTSGEVTLEATTGFCLYIPKGTVHTFKNIGNTHGRLLTLISPAGLEDFFELIGTPATDLHTPPPANPSVINKILELAPKYHMELKLPETSP